MKTNLNDFAFNSDATRLQQTSEKGIEATNPPLTKREYIATMALQGIVSKPSDIILNDEYAAGLAVEYADALIKALNEPQNHAQTQTTNQRNQNSYYAGNVKS